MQKGTNFSLFASCFMNGEKSVIVCEPKKEGKEKARVFPHPLLLLSNQIQLGFCCRIIEMFKCENRNDLHFELNVFTSTNENVPVA